MNAAPDTWTLWISTRLAVRFLDHALQPEINLAEKFLLLQQAIQLAAELGVSKGRQARFDMEDSPVITRATGYATRLLAELAKTNGLVMPLKLVCQKAEIPHAFVNKIAQKLAKAGLLKARRGPGGGVCLARAPADVSLMEVIDAVDGKLHVATGVDAKADAVIDRCSGTFRAALAQTTLAEIMN